MGFVFLLPTLTFFHMYIFTNKAAFDEGTRRAVFVIGIFILLVVVAVGVFLL